MHKQLLKFTKELSKLDSLIDAADRRAEHVSKWSVYKHIEHILLVEQTVLSTCLSDKILEIGEYSDTKLLGKFILLTGFIPRKKGKAPDHVQPMGAVQEELKVMLENCEKLLSQVIELPSEHFQDPNIVFEHPYFGGLTRKQWLKFMVTHHRHHIKIIRDILAARK